MKLVNIKFIAERSAQNSLQRRRVIVLQQSARLFSAKHQLEGLRSELELTGHHEVPSHQISLSKKNFSTDIEITWLAPVCWTLHMIQLPNLSELIADVTQGQALELPQGEWVGFR